MPEPVEKIALLILGWLFGLLSPAIVTGIQRRREAKALKATILRELNDVRYQVASAVYLIDVNQGTTNRGNLEWVSKHLSDFATKEKVPQTIDAIRQMLSLNDEGIAFLAQDGRAKAEATPALKNYSTPIMDSNFASFSYLDHKLQSALMEVRLRLSLLNQNTEEYRTYFQLTYSNQSEQSNRDRIHGNVIMALTAFKQQAIRVADAIREVQLLVTGG